MDFIVASLDKIYVDLIKAAWEVCRHNMKLDFQPEVRKGQESEWHHQQHHRRRHLWRDHHCHQRQKFDFYPFQIKLSLSSVIITTVTGMVRRSQSSVRILWSPWWWSSSPYDHHIIIITTTTTSSWSPWSEFGSSSWPPPPSLGLSQCPSPWIDNDHHNGDYL